MATDLQAIERAAAHWLARQEGGLDEAGRRELARWLAADARHATALAAVERSWARLDDLRGTLAGERLDAELATLAPGRLADYHVRRPARVRLVPWISGALAASVVWAVAYLAWWRPLRIHGPFAEVVATEVGAVRKVTLPDGSVVRLNTDTALDVLFTKAERRVRLGRGEAFFTVAKNPARPFIVTVAGVDVRAVGTEFNVRLHLDAVEVVVREGRVRVDDASNGGSLLAPSAEPAATDAARDILDAGHRVTIPVSAAPKPVVAVTPEPMAVPEIERTLAWREERLVFEAAPLSAIVAEFNRYSRRPMVLADAELAQRRFGGTFDARDSRTFLDLLRTTEGIVAEERSGDILLKPGR